MWLALSLAVAGVATDFAALLGAERLFVEATAANMWQLYVPGLSTNIVTSDFEGDARQIAFNAGWNVTSRTVAGPNGNIYVPLSSTQCGLLEVANGLWANNSLLMSGAGATLLAEDVRIVSAANNDLHTSLCDAEPCHAGHRCAVVGGLPPLCVADRPESPTEDDWLIIGLLLTLIATLIFHVWRNQR